MNQRPPGYEPSKLAVCLVCAASTTPGAVRSGVAFVPADRKRHGAMLTKSIAENVTTVSAGPLRRMGLMPSNSAKARSAEKWRKRLKIKMSSPATLIGELSGANQQKVVFAKWLETDPTVVLLEYPTRAVDVGAKAEMYDIIAEMATHHRIVLITGSDMEELAQVASRVVVFFQGSAVGELSGEDLTEHRLLEAINTGVTTNGGNHMTGGPL
jgi:ABC-type sugar transport system ATPase subunit